MDLSLVAGAIAAASWMLWLRLSDTQRVVVPIALLYGSSLSFGLQGLSQAFAVGGSAMRGAGFAVMALELTRVATSMDGRVVVRPRRSAALYWGAGGLIALLTAHVLLGGRGSLPVTPWGLVFSVFSIVYWVSIASEVRVTSERSRSLHTLCALLACTLFLLVCAVRLGLLVGNTSKFSLGEGGVGLLNLSTNETAAMAIAPLLWSVRLLDGERPWSVRLGYLSILSSAAVVLSSGSRIGVGVTAVVLGAFLLRPSNGTQRVRRLGVALTLAAMVVAGAMVIRSRTAKEVESFAAGNSTSAQFAVPGGERAILWISYLVSFVESAREEPARYLWGGGPAGVAEAYTNSALPALGITIERASFYPVHSDLMELAMTAGLIGVICLGLLARGVLGLSTTAGMSRQRFAALFAFGALSTVDMLQYVPGVVALMWSAFADTVGSEDQMRSTP